MRFEHAGFSLREKGDHIVLSARYATSCYHSEIPSIGLDIIKANMRTVNMSLKEYFKLLAAANAGRCPIDF
jgi:hypothetical protein